jgi:hypothetical protein
MFGNNLIERLRTRLVYVQPPNQFRERSVALEQNLSSKGNAKTGKMAELNVLHVFLLPVALSSTDISQKRKRNVKGVWTNTPLPTPSLRLPSSDPVTFVPSDRLAVQSRSSP